MNVGRMMREDVSTSDATEVQASAELSSDMFKALTSEDGPLASGLPSIKCVNEQGVMNLYQMLDDEGKKPTILGFHNPSSRHKRVSTRTTFVHVFRVLRKAKKVKTNKDGKDGDEAEEVKPKTCVEPGPYLG